MHNLSALRAFAIFVSARHIGRWLIKMIRKLPLALPSLAHFFSFSVHIWNLAGTDLYALEMLRELLLLTVAGWNPWSGLDGTNGSGLIRTAMMIMEYICTVLAAIFQIRIGQPHSTFKLKMITSIGFAWSLFQKIKGHFKEIVNVKRHMF
jgi:hypothetical protein